MPSLQRQAWCFTLNNPTDVQLPSTWPHVFLTWQVEKGEQGTIHLQGYVLFEKRVTLAWIKKEVNSQAHWEPRKGTHDEAVAYCNKKDTRQEGINLIFNLASATVENVAN